MEYGAQQPQAEGASGIYREKPMLPPGELERIKGWCKQIEEAKTYWKDTFKAMRDDAKFARGRQWPGAAADDDRYVANITLRHINQRVANIYAKNPKVSARKRPKLYAIAWDGSQEMLQAALQTQQIVGMAQAAAQQAALAGAAAGVPPDPMAAPALPPTPLPPDTAAAVVKEWQDAVTQKRLYDRMGRTLELVAQYSLDEPIPKFKPQAKQLVRRVLTTGVGYMKLGYQRIMKFDTEDIDARIKDATDKVEQIKMLAADLADGEVQQGSPEAAELKSQIEQLQKQKEVVLREGLIFSFPKSWSMVLDPAVTQLKGFVGAGWLAEEFLFTPEQVKKIFKCDLGSNYAQHTASGGKADKRFKDKKFCAVYLVHDLVGRQCFTLCLGYDGWLKEPGEPDVKLEQFHPYYTLTFNDVEPDADEDTVYPPSDVQLMRFMAMEYNRGREGLRVHRQANRPAYVTGKGAFDDPTKQKFSAHADHEIIESNLSKNDKVADYLQPKPTVPIDPALYETDTVFLDSLRVVGDQSANLGPTSGGTATESSIAENSRVTSIQSNIDDLDEFLTDAMRGAGQILLIEMSAQAAQKIAGPGAVWPEFSTQEVAEELALEIRAGSSGKPNRQQRLSAIEKTAPFLLQTPGIKPGKLAEFMLGEIDEGIDVEDFMEAGLPSIVAMNSQAKPNLAPAPGNEAQGPAGANTGEPGGTSAKAQNMYPAPKADGGGLTPP
jgi:hypothetical protein